MEVISTKEVNVFTPRPVAFQIDGEPHGEVNEVHVANHPQFVEIVIGG